MRDHDFVADLGMIVHDLAGYADLKKPVKVTLTTETRREAYELTMAMKSLIDVMHLDDMCAPLSNSDGFFKGVVMGVPIEVQTTERCVYHHIDPYYEH